MSDKEQMIEDYEDEVIELYNDDGTVERFFILADVTYKDARYGVFTLAEPEEGEEDVGYVFSMEEDGEDMILNEVQDEEIANAVFELYLQQVEEAEAEEAAAEEEDAKA